jgi:hypothetical protein
MALQGYERYNNLAYESYTSRRVKCYSTNRGAPSDGRHMAPCRPAEPRVKVLPSIVLMVLMDEHAEHYMLTGAHGEQAWATTNLFSI